MPTDLRVIGLGGSLAARSSTLAALKIALGGAEEAGARTELFDVRSMGLPMYTPDFEAVPPAVERLCQAVSAPPETGRVEAQLQPITEEEATSE
jgi:NAD(P)H-dependent FMN reductase